MCVRWLVLSVFLPSQQLGKSWMRSTLLPPGQIGYLSMIRFSNPVQVHAGRVFFVPLTAGLASPESAFRNCGIAVTASAALPRKVRIACSGSMIVPSLLPTCWSGPVAPANEVVVAGEVVDVALLLLLLLLLPFLSVHVDRPFTSSCGGWATRPIAVTIRLMVAVRLSFNGPRIAFCTKFGPPWPCVDTRRLSASVICCSSRFRLSVTSVIAWSGTSPS